MAQTDPLQTSGQEPGLSHDDEEMTGSEPSLSGAFEVLHAVGITEGITNRGWGLRERLNEIRDRGRFAVRTLIDLCKHDDVHVRIDAAMVLGWIGDEVAIPTLINLLRDPHSNVRGAARVALANIGQASAPSLMNALLHEEPLVRQNAALALGALRYAGAVSRLSKLVHQDSNVNVAQAAVRALGKIGVKDATVVILTALKSIERDVRLSAVQSLYEIDPVMAVESIIPMLHDESRHVRAKCIQLLGFSHDARAFDLLRPMVSDKDHWIRLAAIRAIARQGDLRVFSVLEEAVNDPHSQVRYVAQSLLHGLRTQR